MKYKIKCSDCDSDNLKHVKILLGKGTKGEREEDMNNPNIEYMTCDICHEKLHPLDAHFGRLKGILITAHIDC